MNIKHKTDSFIVFKFQFFVGYEIKLLFFPYSLWESEGINFFDSMHFQNKCNQFRKMSVVKRNFILTLPNRKILFLKRLNCCTLTEEKVTNLFFFKFPSWKLSKIYYFVTHLHRQLCSSVSIFLFNFLIYFFVIYIL